MMGHLIVRRGPEPGTIYRLDSDEVTIGRGNKNTIIIRDNEVSRDHARIVFTEAGYELYDLNSSNGTFVNGQKVEDVWLLQFQCIVELGDSITLEFRPGEPQQTDQQIVQDLHNHVANDPSYLVVHTRKSTSEPAVYALDKVSIIVGRSTTCDIVIVEPEMSREHFRLLLTGQGYHIEDLGSTNGTFVNGEGLQDTRRLYANDLIQVGEHLRFQFTDSPERFTSSLETDMLAEKKKTRSRRPSDVPNIIQPPPSPTPIGTGVDHMSLEDNVLVTYIRRDWERIVAPMVDRLYANDIGVWVDQYLVENSQDWLVATEQARLECWLLVVVVSPEALASESIMKNLRHFQNREKPVILFIHQPVDRMPMGSRKLTRVQYNPGIPEVAFQQLVNEIRRISG